MLQGQPGLHDSAAHKARDAGVLDGVGDGVQVVIQDVQTAQAVNAVFMKLLHG